MAPHAFAQAVPQRMNASAAMDEICRRFNPSVLAGWVIINPGTGVVEDGGGWLNPHLNPPDDPKMEDPKVIAYEQFTTIAKRVQQAQGGKARRVTIAVRSAQFDLLWVLEKLFVIHRDCS